MNCKRDVIAILMVLLVFIAGCEVGSNKISEGEIIYSIEYLQSEQEMPILNLLPKEMKTKFKQNNTASVIEGFWGTFVMKFITDYQNAKVYTILKLLNKKYIFVSDTSETAPGYEEMLDLKIVETHKDTTFYTESKLPIKCYEAKIYSPIFGKNPIKIYYTFDIDIKNPNIGNPFHKIKGVLVAFQVRLVGIDMKFKIKEINFVKIDDTEFEPPQGYKQISKQEFTDFLKSFTTK